MEYTEKYQWNQDWANQIVHKVPIEKVIEELKAIEETWGEIKPEFVVESAKNKKSALHGYFQWDNEKAADSWRKQQASRLLGQIQLVVVKDGNRKIIRAYDISKQSAFGSAKTYQSQHSDNINFEFIKKITLEDLKRVKTRLDAISLDAVIKYIDKAIEELSKEKEPISLPLQKLEAV
jgi:hypothetical protein